MIEFFVKRPVTTIMFVCVFVVLGLVSLFNLRLEKEPQIDFPIVTVTVAYPGATPLEVETLVINKVEDAVAELAEIKKIESHSYDNFGFVAIEFLMTSDVNIKFIEVKDKVEAIINDLPDAIEKPVIEKYDPLKTPVMDVVLSSDTVDGRDLYEFADKKLRDTFSSVKGVANVTVYGGKKRQINVIADPMLMKQQYITIRNVINSIAAKNRNVPGGSLEKGDTSMSVRFLGEFADPQAIAEMLVVTQDGKQIPLKTIARVEDGFKKIETIARYNGKDVVGLSIEKTSDANAVEISREVRKRLNEFRKELPAGVELAIATDTTDFIITETNDTYWSILIGIILTVVILYVFTGEIRLTFIAAITIPPSLISTFFLMDASHFTINFMTLLAIATVLGTLIANAIVILENVLVHIDKGETPVDAAINGTKGVVDAIVGSAGTNLVVFTPIAFMGGIIGQFFKSFGLTVVYATVFSIVASFTLTPMLCGLLLKQKTGEKKSAGDRRSANPFRLLVHGTDALMDFLKREYEKIFRMMFRFPKTSVFVFFLLFWSMQFIMPYVGNEFHPSSDEDLLTVKIEMPQGSTIDRTFAVTRQVEARVAQIPELESYLTAIGDDGVENAAVVINLVPLAERTRSDVAILQELVLFMAQIPDADIMVERGEARGGMSGDISIDVHGSDYEKMAEIAQAMKQKMEKTGYFRSIKSSYRTPKKEVRFIPNQSRLISHGLQDVVVADSIRSSVYGDDSNVYKEAGEEYAINVKLDDRYTEDLDDIGHIDVISSKGMVPVSELGQVLQEKAMPAIRHRDKVRIIRLDGFLSKSEAGFVKGVLDKEFKSLNFESGYGYRYTGMAEYQAESAKETGKAFLLAIVLTYMLLCAIMNSFTHPMSILIVALASFLGVFVALFFFEQSINVASMLGIVMLVGIVVNNSILIIDYAVKKMDDGVPIDEALWLGASEKFRAVMMTSLAIILGVIPQLWATMPVKVSMGVVMIGGILASIIFAFLLTPLAFWYIEKMSLLFSRGRKKHA